MPTVDAIRRALAAGPARLHAGGRRAAVAIVLTERGGQADMLFIERARRLGDPWSGHMAFPGGRVDPDDRDERAAAERETYEEVGLDLCAAELLGRLDDLHAGVPVVAPLVLSAFVYRLGAPARVVTNHEVRAALWVPVPALVDPGRHVPYRSALRAYPGVCVGQPDRHVVWGLTYRLLEDLFARLGVSFARLANGEER